MKTQEAKTSRRVRCSGLCSSLIASWRHSNFRAALLSPQLRYNFSGKCDGAQSLSTLTM